MFEVMLPMWFSRVISMLSAINHRSEPVKRILL